MKKASVIISTWLISSAASQIFQIDSNPDLNKPSFSNRILTNEVDFGDGEAASPSPPGLFFPPESPSSPLDDLQPLKTSFDRCEHSTEVEGKLICTCESTDRVLQLSQSNRQAIAMIRRQLENTTRLEIVLCSLDIKPDFFPSLRMSLTSLEIRGAKSLLLSARSLAFAHQDWPMGVSVGQVGEPITLEANTFGRAVRRARFDGVKFYEFSTDMFLGIHSTAEVIISNSTISAKFNQMNAASLTLKSLEVVDSDVEHPGHTFMDLSAQSVLFRRCHLNLFIKDALKANVGRIAFEDCEMRLLGDALKISAADSVVFRAVRLLQPKQRSLAGLAPSADGATLQMVDVVLDDPSKGSLSSEFTNVEFRNISVSPCFCNVTRLLVSDTEEIGSRIYIPGLVYNEALHKKLENETFCLEQLSDDDAVQGGSRKRPQELCSLEGGSLGRWLLALLLVALALALALLAAFLYRWHRLVEMKYRLIRAMRVVSPAQQQQQQKKNEGGRDFYREQREVTFRETVKVIPRMSTVFCIDQDAAPLDGSNPDLIHGVRGSIYYKGFASKDLSLEQQKQQEEKAKKSSPLSSCEDKVKASKEPAGRMSMFEVIPLDEEEEEEEYNPGDSIIVRESVPH